MRLFATTRTVCVGLLLALPAGMACADSPGPAPGAQGEEISTLKKMVLEQMKLIQQLTQRVDKLEKEKAAAPPGVPPVKPPGEEPDIPPLEIPGQKPPAGGGGQQPANNSQTVGTTRASLTPDIAVIGNNVGRFFSRNGDPDRNRFQLGEVEIALEQPVYPGVKFKAQLAGGFEDGFKLAAEEAYVQFAQLGHTPLSAYLGQKRLNFGKINSVHPHARPYADQPAVIQNLLGPDGLSGNGASLNYLFPFKNLFANLEVGFYKTDAAEEGVTLGPTASPAFYPAGLGVNGNFPFARLWTSKEIGKSRELELGASYGFGRGDFGDRVNITGVDLTYRSFPGTFKRLMLQGEAYWHQRHDALGGTGAHTRSGHYALLTYQPNQYTEFGFRYDNSEFPWPLPGREQSYSLIWSNRLTEATILRLQYKYGNRTSDVFLPAHNGFSELYLQFIWGAGSHTHPLQ